MQQGQVERGLALLDEAMVAVTAGELSPLVTGLIYCSVIEGCQQVYAFDRAREWTAALAQWCEEQPEMVAFTGVCLVHRAEIMQLRGAWQDAIEEARRACERFAGASTRRPPPRRSTSKPRCTACAASSRRPRRRTAARASGDGTRSRAWPCCGWRRDAARRGGRAIRRVVSATTDRLQRARLLPAYVEIMLAAGDIDEARGACDELEEIAERFDTGRARCDRRARAGAVELAEGDAQAALGLAAPRLAGVASRSRRRTWPRACGCWWGWPVARSATTRGPSLELDAARAVFEQLGAAPDLARLDALAKGAPSARPART